MEAYELFQAARALQHKEHKTGEAINLYQLVIDTYPESAEAEKAAREIDMMTGHHHNDTRPHFDANRIATAINGWFNLSPDNLPGLSPVLIVIGIILMLGGFILAFNISKPIHGDPVSDAVTQSLQNNFKAVYIAGGIVSGLICFIGAVIIGHLAFIKQELTARLEEEKTRAEISKDVPNQSFVKRYYERNQMK